MTNIFTHFSCHLQPSEKTKKILNIWEEGAGVVNVQVFHNSLAMVAYTREAAIIDAVGMLPRLTFLVF